MEVRAVKKVFHVKRGDIVALDGMSLSVRDGEFLSIIGPSGCGKTTFLQLVAGLEKPTSGEILIDGNRVDGLNPRSGMVFQEYSLLPWRTVMQNIELGLKFRGAPEHARFEIARKYVTLVGLSGFEDRYPHELSGGMKQRVALARALAYEPEILLMDEPFASVDAQRREMLQQEILSIWEKIRNTVVFVTHSVNEAVFLADRVAVLTSRPGRVKEIVRVDLPRPRSYLRVSKEFTETEKYLRELLEPELR